MPFNEIVVNGKPGMRGLELSVTVSGMAITVHAGLFSSGSSNYELLTDQTYTADPNAVERQLTGYLVKVVATGQVELLVDELLYDGIDRPFDFSDGTYEMIQRLFRVTVPGGTSDLAPLDTQLLRIAPTAA